MANDQLKAEILSLEKKLKDGDIEGKSKRLQKLSMDVLKSSLFMRYGSKKERVIFNEKDALKSLLQFQKEYPVVLSTCFSSRSSLRSASYDYVIMDEASQISLAEGALALSAAKNAVIVGDVMQLANVIKEDDIEKYDETFKNSGLGPEYSYTEHSFLSSLLSVVKDAPSTMLREHYRCRNKIIEFSNEKFYDGLLIPMRGDGDGKDTIKLLRTAKGHFRRGNANKRQQEVLMEYIKSELGFENLNDDNFAVSMPVMHPYHTVGLMVDDDGDVLVPLAVAGLVYADLLQSLKSPLPLRLQVGKGAGDAPAYSLPVDALLESAKKVMK